MLTELLGEQTAYEAVSDMSPAALVAVDAGNALLRACGVEVVSYRHALTLWGLSYISDLGQSEGLTRQQRVLAFQDVIQQNSPDYAMLTAMRAASVDSQDKWALLISHFAYLIDAFADWLSGSIPTSLVDGLTDEAGSLIALVTPKIQVKGSTDDSTSVRADDVLSRLERLQQLRTAGAVTEEEFTQMKAQILATQP